MTGLRVDFERPIISELIDIEPAHTAIVLQPFTNDYSYHR